VRRLPAAATLDAKFQIIKSIIDSGKLGTIYHVHHNHLARTTFIEWNPSGAWAMNKMRAGGGPFIDWGVYDLSFHLGLLDDVPQLKSLRSFSRNDLRDITKLVQFSDVEQHGAAWLEFDTVTFTTARRGMHAETPNERGSTARRVACASNSPPGIRTKWNSFTRKTASHAKKCSRWIQAMLPMTASR
jgi:predicted dehydrogenase